MKLTAEQRRQAAEVRGGQLEPLTQEPVTLLQGDRVSEAKVKMSRGHVLRDRGDVDAALAQYLEAEALDRAAGDDATRPRRRGAGTEGVRGDLLADCKDR
ncbi:MAG: hypothetical protein WBV82_03455 [Myxococcaceae bacterium]